MAGLAARPARQRAAPNDLDALRPVLELARERERTRERKQRVPPGRLELREAQHQLEQAHVPTEASAPARWAPRVSPACTRNSPRRAPPKATTRRGRRLSQGPRLPPARRQPPGATRRRAVRRARLRGARAAIDASLTIDPRSVQRQPDRRQSRLRTRSAGPTPSRAFATWPRATRIACAPGTASSCTGWRSGAAAWPSPSSCSAPRRKAGRSRCCCTCVANTPKPN